MGRKRAGIKPLWNELAKNSESEGIRLEQLTSDPLGPHRLALPYINFEHDFPSKAAALRAAATAGSYPYRTKSDKVHRSFALDGTLENYFNLRTRHPKVKLTLEPHLDSGSDDLFDAEIKNYGFDPRLIRGLMSLDDEMISFFCLDMMENMSKQKIKKRKGSTSVIRRRIIPSDAFVDNIIAEILATYSFNNKRAIHHDLVALIFYRLSKQSNLLRDKYDSAQRRSDAIRTGARLLAMGKAFSLRSIAKELGVAPSTISRWFAPGELIALAQRESTKFDTDGTPLRARRKKPVAQK